MSHAFDHVTPNANLLIYQMVLNRLPFIVANSGNQTMISQWTWELMNQLEPCFKVTAQAAPSNVVGMEENYSVNQQSIIADLIAVYVLFLQAAGGYNFGAGINTNPATYLKRAKAGSAEVEYDEFDQSKANSSKLGNTSLVSFYKKSAINKAASLGCLIEICDDCSLNIQTMLTPNVVPFIVVSGCGCG